MTENAGAGVSTGYVCRYCRLSSDASGPACPSCGAPVDVREIRDDEGWVEQPPIRDLARIQAGRSQCQIAGSYVPIVEMNLAPGDQVYFSHHVLLWADPATQLAARPMQKGWDRRKAGMPLVMMEATGPGRIAFSDDDPGELIAVPLEVGQSIDVTEHHFLVATAAVSYDWTDTVAWWAIGPKNQRDFHFPRGRYSDRFTAQQRGLLLLHARGNAFIRDLRDGELIYVVPRALVYKDTSVHMNIHMERPASPRAHWQVIPMIKLTGPGRVAIQSQYGFEDEAHWGWDLLGPDGSWRNWNPDPDRWRPVIKEREPLHP
jgi:uncharacterized protein (AIM24 family)